MAKPTIVLERRSPPSPPWGDLNLADGGTGILPLAAG
jgi:hypothetical protein